MHGVVFVGLREFVRTNHDDDTWQTVLVEADVESQFYSNLQTYPDEELLRLVEAASDATGAAEGNLLREFGRFIVPDLVETYDAFLDDEWGALDLLEHTEDAMHKAVRLKEDGAAPPELECHRPRDDEVVLEYSSSLQLCRFGEGLALGVGDVYETPLQLTQSSCMLDGDPSCELHVRRA